MKYILTETEMFAHGWEHTETFDTLEEAQSRMKELYHQNAVEANSDAIIKAEISERSAMVEVNDGNVIEWDIAVVIL